MSVFTGDHSLVHCNMASLTPSSTNISLTQAVSLTTNKSNILSRPSILRNVNKHKLTAQRHALPLSTSIRLFPQFHIGCVLKPKHRTLAVYASGTDVAVEEADLSLADSEASVSATNAAETGGESAVVPETSPIKSQRSRPSRKSDMPPVKNEELIAGATFTGKVRSIQPFGAFVDFGAFTDGLVHVSQLSDSYVKDVANIVSVGQEVTVRLVEANLETGRISLSMRSDSSSRVQQQRESPDGNDKSRPPRRMSQNSNQRRDEPKKFSKFVKGQDLEGTVKNLTRAGAFISLPEDEEGFLPQSEENDEGFGSIMGVTSLEVGQEVSVRVLRISRGQVTLTMKKDEDVKQLDSKLTQGTVHTATNPFVLAFRSNESIATFLDERESEKQQAEEAEEISKDADDMVASITEDTSAIEKKSEDSETKDDEVRVIEEVQASSVLVGDDGSPQTEDQETNSLTEAEESNDGDVSGGIADISSQIVENAIESLVDNATSEDELAVDPGSVAATERDIEQQQSGESTNQTRPGVTGEETPKAADDVIAEVEEKSEEADSSTITQDNEVTAAINPVESDSLSAETESGDIEAKPAESPVTISDNLGVDIAVNGEENQTSADPQPNGDASNSIEQSSNESPKETVVKGVQAWQ